MRGTEKVNSNSKLSISISHIRAYALRGNSYTIPSKVDISKVSTPRCTNVVTRKANFSLHRLPRLSCDPIHCR